MGDNLKKNMIGALTWSTVNLAGVQLSQLIIGIILARILMPSDFGTIGVLFFFIGFSTVLIDGGFGQGLIRKQDTTAKDLNSVFIFNFLLAISLYILLFFSAPLISNFFSIPALTTISRILFLSVIIFSFYFIQQVQLYKKLDYKSIAIINIISVVISGISAAFLAIKGFGVWALVFQQLLTHVVKAILYPFFLKWKPSFHFSFKIIRNLAGFSVPLLGQTLLNVIFNNIYVLIIGRFFSIVELGYFTQANKYSETINTATTNILSTGTFPVFSQIQDERERLLRIYRRLMNSVSIIVFPLVAFLFISAHPLIITLIKEKWESSVILFQILVIANIFTPLYTININVLNARGQSKSTLKLEIVKKSLIIFSILLCFSFGIKTMLVGFVIANLIAFIVSMFLIKSALGHFYKHQISDFISVLMLVSLIGFFVGMINFTNWSNFVKLVVEGFLFLSIYIVAVRYIFPENFFEFKNGLLKKFH